MTNDKNITVTVSKHNGTWQVFATNIRERFVFLVTTHANRTAAMKRAELVADRFSCAIEC